MHKRLSALATMFFASGCAVPGEPSHLAHSTWRFVSIDGEKPAASQAALVFEEEALDANVGCNALGGPWRTEDDRIIAGPLAQTEMFCEGQVWTQEKAIGALLVAAPRFELDGDTMVLRSNGHTARLRRENAGG
jgi:heat shock protein HslJ